MGKTREYGRCPMTDFYQFYLNTKVLFQPGIARDFSNEISQMGVERFFLICDPFFYSSGLAQEIISGVEAAGAQVVGIFHEVPPNSELSVVESCARLAKSSGAEALIALGGGSALDTAKAANIVFSLGGNLVEDFSGSQTLTSPLRPLVAIPTTAGTGSEVTGSAVILDAKTHTKLAFNDQYLRPSLALLDPEITLTLPPKVTAMTGMDALTHAVEAYTSLQSNPMSDALALYAIRLIRKHLLPAVLQGEDLETRSQMMIAANMAGIAFDHAMVGVVHSMAHAAGGVAGVPHGLANHIFLPFGMEYNLEAVAERYSHLAQALDMKSQGLEPESGARQAIAGVRRLQQELAEACGLPQRLRDAGVQENQLEEIARLAVEDGSSFFNPREVDYDSVLQKIKEAY